mgnify:CR=1 FL=1
MELPYKDLQTIARIYEPILKAGADIFEELYDALAAAGGEESFGDADYTFEIIKDPVGDCTHKKERKIISCRDHAAGWNYVLLLDKHESTYGEKGGEYYSHSLEVGFHCREYFDPPEEEKFEDLIATLNGVKKGKWDLKTLESVIAEHHYALFDSKVAWNYAYRRRHTLNDIISSGEESMNEMNGVLTRMYWDLRDDGYIFSYNHRESETSSGGAHSNTDIRDLFHTKITSPIDSMIYALEELKEKNAD